MSDRAKRKDCDSKLRALGLLDRSIGLSDLEPTLTTSRVAFLYDSIAFLRFRCLYRVKECLSIAIDRKHYGRCSAWFNIHNPDPNLLSPGSNINLRIPQL
jgi:hypothetical protein